MMSAISVLHVFFTKIDILGFLWWIRTLITHAAYYNNIIAIALLKTAKSYPTLRTNP